MKSKKNKTENSRAESLVKMKKIAPGSSFMNVRDKESDLAEVSIDQLILNEKIINSKSMSEQEENSENMDVPIYKIQTTSISFKATLSNQSQSYYAEGTLIGQFFSLQEPVILTNIKFVGNFKGAIETPSNSNQGIYFEGSITQFLLIGDKNRKQRTPVIEELELNHTSFRGFFHGSFYYWSEIGTLKNFERSPKRLMEISQRLSLETQSHKNCNNFVLNCIQNQKKVGLPEYFLPTVVRFEVQDIKEINLEKSMAIVSGVFYLEIRYNDTVKALIKNTNNIMKEMKKKGINLTKYENLLKIELTFHRDFNLTLSLEETNLDEQDSQAQSEGSEWSIMDKTWDIQLEDDEQRKTFKFRVWKRFNVEIDNSYGSFFAPFNLSILRIVMSIHHFTVRDFQNNKIRVHLISTDVLDYDPSIRYNPFQYLMDLENHQYQANQTSEPQINRIHKINRFKCKDSGTYIIADNRLSLFPHYRNTLINKNTANEETTWRLGLKDRLSLIETPTVRSISDSYNYYLSNGSKIKVESFSLQKWNYSIVEIPIYKYVIIDMIQIFAPLTLLSVISLLIFNQINGVSDDTGFTTLAWRLLNVSTIMIAYVSLIPVLRDNLPPMPGITLIQIVTYTEVIPNFLALASSLIDYNMSTNQWLLTYHVLGDIFFVVSISISILNLIVLIVLFTVYVLKQYTAKQFILPPPSKRNYKYRSPCYMRFMNNVKKYRQQYKLQVQND